MRILILSFYFEPDLSAGSFRTTALVDALEAEGGPSLALEVLTTVPNRYRSFSQEAPAEETRGRTRVFRFRLPSHQSGMADQAWAYTHYARAVMRHIRGQRYDVVYATSSRLFTAVLGAYVARRTGAALYLDIRDIFNDTIREVLNRPLAALLTPVLDHAELYAVRTAAHINLVSEGFRGYFQQRYPQKRYSFHSNGIDEGFCITDMSSPARVGSAERRVVLYAGNIGEGQGLHRIVPKLASRLPRGYELWIVGDGGKKRELQEAIASAKVTNVRLLEPVSRPQLLALYQDSDYLFLHLNDYQAFHKVLPSKIFEYAATGKPILAGVAGYAADFIQDRVENAAVFPPCDAEAGARALRMLDPQVIPRTRFIAEYRRTRIMRRLAREVLQLGEAPCNGSAGVESFDRT